MNDIQIELDNVFNRSIDFKMHMMTAVFIVTPKPIMNPVVTTGKVFYQFSYLPYDKWTIFHKIYASIFDNLAFFYCKKIYY